ncbi:MAG: hypothetical protein KDK45_22480, partial [Leptospiraceae bacterium]|nr:hypothetical protein [Leptospiraceae bacterium]
MYRFILLLIAFFLSIPLFSEENKLDLTFISIQSESVNISGISYPIFIYTDPQKQYKTIDKVIYDKEDGEI